MSCNINWTLETCCLLEKTDNDAFKGINSKAVIKVPKGKADYYKKIVYSKGAGKSVKVK